MSENDEKLNKAKVIIEKLSNIHQNSDYTKYELINDRGKEEIFKSVEKILNSLDCPNLLKKTGKKSAFSKNSKLYKHDDPKYKAVWIKPNGIDAKVYCYTRAEVVEAVVVYFKNLGVKNIFLFENSTQSNCSRLVFEVNGYKKICKKYKIKPVYLDEYSTIKLKFKEENKKELINGPDAKMDNQSIPHEDYELKEFAVPEIIYEALTLNRHENFYINVPKLKTHSMGVVTLGIKNQWAFPSQFDRRIDHNFNLHSKLVDLLAYFQPDITLIDGIEGTIYGHYPATSLANKFIKPFEILIGGNNVVATDMVGARVLNIPLKEIPQISLAIEKGYSKGVKRLEDINIIGDISQFTETYPYDLSPEYHPDVNIVMGKKLLCKEGCRNNPLTLLQILYFDYGGKGGWDLVIGKGHYINEIDMLKGPVLIAGDCAINEVSDRLIKRLGRKNVYLSRTCNDLAATASSMFRLTKVSPFRMVKINPLKAIWILTLIKIHHSRANVPSLFSKRFKKT